MELTKAQQIAIQQLKPRLKAHGWAFVKPTMAWDMEGGIAVEAEFLVKGKRHWLRFLPNGNVFPAPVTMCTKDGADVF